MNFGSTFLGLFLETCFQNFNALNCGFGSITSTNNNGIQVSGLKDVCFNLNVTSCISVLLNLSLLTVLWQWH